MKTVWKNLIGAVALVGVSTLVTTQVVSQDHGYGEADMEEMMKEWIKLAEPGAEHARLAKFAGKWEQQTTHWAYPGAEPSVSTGTATFESILGGRFMIEKVKSKMEFMGEMHDFEGFGLFGFDNLKQKHFWAWVDTFGTLMMIAEGEENATGDEITYFSELPNPQTGGVMKFKSVSKMIDYDNTVFEMHEYQADGTWRKNMEITSKRKKY